MAAPADLEPNTPERVVSRFIALTWLFWLVGALYLVGPILAWLLAGWAAFRCYVAPNLPKETRPPELTGLMWCWLAGMAAMLLILQIGHINYELGLAQTLKSVFGWAKGWALLALLPVAGFLLPIRSEVVARAVCKLGLQILCVLPIFLFAPVLGLPGTLWTSPLSAIGGSTTEYFTTVLYSIDPSNGQPRWQFFAPWSPAAGMIAVLQLFLVQKETHAGWRWTGYAGALAMGLLSQSRMVLVALVFIPVLVLVARKLKNPAIWLFGASVTLVAGWIAPRLFNLVQEALDEFSSARAESSRVRATLGRIALERWQNEAYWFGHGVVERGPHLVEYMMIGSHHSWYGLLFVKGLMGAVALAIPMAWTLIAFLVATIRGKSGELGLGIALVLWLYSFGENLETLAYIIWPALLALGIAMRELSFANRRGSDQKEES